MVDLVWTSKQPTEPGYYWLGVDKHHYPDLAPPDNWNPEIIKVVLVDKKFLMDKHTRVPILNFHPSSRFAGPIPIPLPINPEEVHNG